jgi:hypothetical protein
MWDSRSIRSLTPSRISLSTRRGFGTTKAPGQIVPTFDATLGATNTLDLIVDGTEALIGINGDFLAGLDVQPSAESDVYIGTGFFGDHTVEGGQLFYGTFAVRYRWSQLLVRALPRIASTRRLDQTPVLNPFVVQVPTRQEGA